MDAKAPQRGALHRVLDNSGTAAFLGAIVGGVLTGVAALSVAAIQEVGESDRLEMQRAEADRDATAQLRLDAYQALLSTAEDFKIYAAERVLTCKPGTDEPRRKNQPCIMPLATYERAQHEAQSAINEVHRVGSEEGLAALMTMASAMPPTLYTGGPPVEEAPDDVTFSAGYDAMLDVMKCETVPDAPSWCSTTQ